MKRLDKYIAKNFLIGYAISFFVLIGLRIIVDLFVNIDEFTEHSGLGTVDIIKNIFIYYGLNSTLYFRDFAGFITVIAAVFSLGKMVRNNEFVAMMASGVSLKRVITPIIILALLLTVLLVMDQELIIPSQADKLVRSEDDLPGQESYDVWFIADSNGSLICSRRFDVATSTLQSPTILIRKRSENLNIWQLDGKISADKAVYNPQTKKWDLVNGLFTRKEAASQARKIESFSTDITPKDIPVRRKSEYKTLLSSSQLAQLAAQKTKIRDLAQLYSQRHFRITEPVINLLMLMVCLPILICRDPKQMKSAVMISFIMAGACSMITFACKMLATEMVFDRVMPELWPWVPVFIFLPIAFIELDSMKT
jgi:lipopolysaccharide export system permease protein